MSTVNLADALRWPTQALLRQSAALNTAPWVDSAALDLGYEVAFPFLAESPEPGQAPQTVKDD